MTTTTLQEFNLSPDIILGKSEHHQLTVLAMAGSGHSADIADALLYELGRALVVADPFVPPDAVRMGSTVRYRSSREGEREVTLVYPAEARDGSDRLSVLTQVGTALVGLRRGQAITWLDEAGHKQVLTVLSVAPPAWTPDDDPGPSAA